MTASLASNRRERDTSGETFQMSIRQTWAWVVLLTLIAAATWLVASVVSAHPYGASSVDDCEIRWEDDTQYDAARSSAQNAWEDLKGSDNCVDLAEDTWYTVADLEWVDVNMPEVDWAGNWTLNSGTAEADTIELNTHYMDSYNACTRKGVAMHELGHAHGIYHSFYPNIMYRYLPYNFCLLRDHDEDDYEELWGPR